MYVNYRWIPMLGAVLVLSALAAAPIEAVAQSACTQTISAGANVGTAISNSSAGSTICLNDGSYSGFTLSGVGKNPRVTVRAVNQGRASFTSVVVIRNGSYGVTFDGVNFESLWVGQSPNDANLREFTFRNYNMTGQLVVDYVTTPNPNLVFEYFTHNNITAAKAPNARMVFYAVFPTNRTTPVATVRYGTIDGGCADGIQAGSPVVVEYTEFRNMQVGSCPNDPHTDAFQFYGGNVSSSIVRGNYFYNNIQVLTAYDGISGVLIENNVFDPGPGVDPRPCQIELYSDDGSIVRHNTVLNRRSGIGGICLDRKSSNVAGKNTVLIDNIAGFIAVNNGSTYKQRTNNLLASGAIGGEISGSPIFVGGTTPSSLAGFELTAASPGKGAALSPAGSDIGADVSAAAAKRPAPPTGVSVAP